MKIKTFFTIGLLFFILFTARAQIRVTDEGRIGLRTLTPSYEIETFGTMKFGSNYGNFIFNNSGMYGAFTMYPEADWLGHLGLNDKRFGLIYGDHIIARMYTTSSDARIKENIETLAFTKDNPIYQLRPVSYDFKRDYFTGIPSENDTEFIDQMRLGHFGFLAQEVNDILPELVDKSDPQLYSMNYMEIIPFLVSAVQEQRMLIENLEASNKDLNDIIQNGTIGSLDQENEEVIANLFTVFPNPFSSSTEIRLNLENVSGNTYVLLTKLDGEIIKEYRINTKVESITVDQNAIKIKGIYLVSIVQDGIVLKSEKLIYQ